MKRIIICICITTRTSIHGGECVQSGKFLLQQSYTFVGWWNKKYHFEYPIIRLVFCCGCCCCCFVVFVVVTLLHLLLFPHQIKFNSCKIKQPALGQGLHKSKIQKQFRCPQPIGRGVTYVTFVVGIHQFVTGWNRLGGQYSISCLINCLMGRFGFVRIVLMTNIMLCITMVDHIKIRCQKMTIRTSDHDHRGMQKQRIRAIFIAVCRQHIHIILDTMRR
mmetsp:Transcript_17673/g.20024  ORF Transcript_17673/g.20024 Transcript_17673/m.20024 type:complete len:219 (+) Transcript_17673:23-679(+)